MAQQFRKEPSTAQACINFRRNLAAYIKAHKGVSQRSIAEKIGGAQSNVNHVISGRCEPGLEYVQRIADAIGVAVEDLISNEKRFRVYLTDDS